MNPRRIPREASRIGVLASAAYLAAAFIAVPSHLLNIHTTLALYGAILLFPHSVAIAYVASAARRPAKPLILASLTTISYLIGPLLALYTNTIADILFIISSLTIAYASLEISKERKASVRISLLLTTYTYIITVITIILTDLYNISFPEKALALTIAYPLTLIYAVTIHSFPSTFGDQPNPGIAPIPHVIAALAAILVILNPQIALLLATLSLLAYIPTARLYKIRNYYEKIKGMDPSKPAYKGMKYFLDGHASVIINIITTIILTMYLMKTWSTLAALHLLLLGPVLIHIAIHEPMMIPVILGIKHKRLFFKEVYIMPILASIVWPFNPPLAYLILIIYFLLLIIMTF